jgi:oxidase EvaA
MGVGPDFLGSAQARADQAVTPDPEAVLSARTQAHDFRVCEVPLRALSRWRLGDDLAHETRRFFTIEGLLVETNFGTTPRWTQPIIMQPEIGMLGFVAKRLGGVLHLLAQAKMEPGNHVTVQVTPTVQATPSNYLRVHGGRATPYLEYFLPGPARGRVLVDQLQSEQGSRYYRKRNRNMIVELPEDREVELGDDFAWLTLAQIRTLLATGNRVNMNARTVLGCIAFGPAETRPSDPGPFREAVLASHLADAKAEVDEASTWLADVKTEVHLDARPIPLGKLERWIVDDESLRHESGRFFRVIGVEVQAGSREVVTWTQPMVAPVHQGQVLLLCQRREGLLRFLLQARVEPGFIDRVELAPTVQVAPGNIVRKSDLPPLAEYLSAPEAWVRLHAPQSEDGGRFYHADTDHLIVELPEDEQVELPPGFHGRWLTLAAIKRLMASGYYVDVEARSLVSCLG